MNELVNEWKEAGLRLLSVERENEGEMLYWPDKIKMAARTRLLYARSSLNILSAAKNHIVIENTRDSIPQDLPKEAIPLASAS